MNRKEGLPLVISAPSGAGKSTLIKKLVAEFPAYIFSVSCTTRKPREGEIEGKDYYFISQEEFLKRKDNNFFAEWAEVHGNFYGTPLKEVQDNLQNGKDMIFDIDIQGATQLALSLPEAYFIFIFPPSMETLEERLKTRGTDNQESIQKRLANAIEEIKQSHWFDAWVVNDNIDEAYALLRACTLAAKAQPHRQKQLINTLIHANSLCIRTDNTEINN